MPGNLFTHYFLTNGIKSTDEWKGVAPTLESFRGSVNWPYQTFKTHHEPNEASTEQDLIRPVLGALGWTEYLPQQPGPGNEDIPDHLLFGDSVSKARASSRESSQDRYLDTLVVEESKRFGLSLESRDPGDKVQSSTPHGQILRYLSTAENVTDGRIRWGILTNGGTWRLYDYRARPRSTAYYEANLAAILENKDDESLLLFLLLFGRNSFTPQQGNTASFIDYALEEGRRYEERVAEDLSGTVFDRVYPELLGSLADASGKELSEVRDAALTFLYRTLFLLYAEDRGLLPVNDSRYDDYSLRRRVRDDVARRMQQCDVFSGSATTYHDHLGTLFRLIDKGDPTIGLPPYNGGLFAGESAPLLEGLRLPDSVVAPLVYALSHTRGPEGMRFVNYRDMSVQQLGSIYERLLEREPARDAEGKIFIRPDSYARKDSGSYFTPQELVDLIVDHTLKPLADERLRAFEDKSRQLRSDRRPREARRSELAKLDPAEAVLDLKVLDPAMGSGHFLVTAVDFLSDYIAEMVERTPAVPDWLGGEYVSPLVKRVEAIRADILGRAKEFNWAIDEALLTDQAIIRRMVLKRCIFGVDKNPLTVELAKVSLWLHSFTAGAPLSFLDHHLRCGDSLVGLRISDIEPELKRLGKLFAGSAIAGAEAAATQMREIESMSDADISEVRESAALFQNVQSATGGLRTVMDVLAGMRWLTAGMKATERRGYEAPLAGALSEEPQAAYNLLATGPASSASGEEADHNQSESAFGELWGSATAVAATEGFLHWEASFPGVWQQWQNLQPVGGFDAVIGNPPWDRIKLQEVEWFATRSPELALAPTAAARRNGIKKLRDAGDPLTAEFDAARDRADRLGRVARSSGHYPKLSGGDINLYSLFVERAMSLLKPDGMVGLLTPSGIYADKTAADFFKSVSTGGRLAGLFDFENRRTTLNLPPFFPDVDSRFKFCALIFGGSERTFEGTECSFFLQDVATLGDPERCFPLAPADFARVNPNTGTAPVFRTRRDADITRRIYESHPVLVDRSQGEEKRAWPVRYRTMFHMTNDSHLFRTAAQLDAEGFYPVEGNRWRKGDELYLPLYQGRMIHQFDHRANSVRVNPESTHNPYLSEEVNAEQHADPGFLPQSQYWIPEKQVAGSKNGEINYSIGFRDIARSSDARTAIASIVPRAGYGNKVPLLVSQDTAVYALLAANLNSFCFDFVVRQKLQGTSFNLYILEQLPVISPEAYDRKFGHRSARELVSDHVLRLTYTANDMIPFARDLGCDGRPSFGMRKTGATCGPGWTPSISTFTASPEKTLDTSWTPFPLSGAMTKSGSASTAPETWSWHT